MTALEYIKKFAPYTADSLSQRIFPATSLAISYLESNKATGLSKLAEVYNNMHGIQVYPKWTGPTVRMTDNKTGSSRVFCVYPNKKAGFQGFIDFLKRNPRYEKAGVFTAKTPQEQVKRIAAAGYSESAAWQKLVLSIADKYQPSNNKVLDLIKLFATVLIFGYSFLNLLQSWEGLETIPRPRK